MEIYPIRLELFDYLFWVTAERGKVYETGAFIHNYALAYALGLAHSPYSHMQQKPAYESELAEANRYGVYLTPARPIAIQYRLTQWNTIRETYRFAAKPRSIGYPDWGFARVVRPGSIFECYLLVRNSSHLPASQGLGCLLESGACHVRLGKFMAKAELHIWPADQVVYRGEGQFVAEVRRRVPGAQQAGMENAEGPLLLNWRDMLLAPVVCDICPGSIPSRLIANAHFSGAHYIATFNGQTVTLPAEMSFVARSLDGSVQRRRL